MTRDPPRERGVGVEAASLRRSMPSAPVPTRFRAEQAGTFGYGRRVATLDEVDRRLRRILGRGLRFPDSPLGGCVASVLPPIRPGKGLSFLPS